MHTHAPSPRVPDTVNDSRIIDKKTTRERSTFRVKYTSYQSAQAEHLRHVILHTLYKPDSIMSAPPRAEKDDITVRRVPRKQLRTTEARYITHCDTLAPYRRALLPKCRHALRDLFRSACHQSGDVRERGQVRLEERVENRL
jgi:hypothetical protein